MTSTDEDRTRRPLLIALFVNLGLGFLFLVIGFSRPSIKNMRPNDLVTLLAAGACLGMGLVLLLLKFVGRGR